MATLQISLLRAYLLAGIFLALTSQVFASDPYRILGAQACCTPGYGTLGLQQGCCEFPFSCCYDVWAGYCENKKLREARKACGPHLWSGLWSRQCVTVVPGTPPQPCDETESPKEPAPLPMPEPAPPNMSQSSVQRSDMLMPPKEVVPLREARLTRLPPTNP